jgi:hypothetical protein
VIGQKTGLTTIVFKDIGKMKRNWKFVLLALLIGLSAVGIYTYFFVYNKPHRNFEKEPAAFTLTAEELFLAFVTDEASAETEYIGKVVEVTGRVDSVKQIDDLVIISFVFEEGIFGPMGVRGTMLENHRVKALELEKNQNIVIKGYCAGFTGNDVILEHCSLQ